MTSCSAVHASERSATVSQALLQFQFLVIMRELSLLLAIANCYLVSSRLQPNVA